MSDLAVVTGGANGLGDQIFKVLEDKGYEVLVFDTNRNGYDVRSEEDAEEFFDTIVGEGSTVDILVNNAGVNGLSHIEDLERDEWDEIMDTNAWGVFNVTQKAIPYLTEDSKVINIVSEAREMAMSHSTAYNASKAACEMITRQMAREMSPMKNGVGCAVMGVAPNKLQGTEMSNEIDQQVADMRGWDMEKVREYQENAMLAQEETDPRHVAELVGYLADGNTSFMTGCVVEAGK